ncbi:hypothetical protein T8K17_24590 [Thalassobaculum sp. OXR-137]|uniref:hypothetical protein n=1 Tax=Thalassobaculum sp. OXR-137 TaxID=3100173 RepID=UPI002AC9B5C9|nr:hypothetical protein [Thalassobaculum sp. OXR-137]WPZ34398.1 hypothetical protein T8K17_24590 [Thalassobaculum sp. OXR-137]
MTAVPAFDRFYGIDWSGSKARRLPGLRVAECAPGTAAPNLLDGPQSGGLWRRLDVLALLEREIAAGTRVLAGFDFAFAYAHADRGAYFPETGPDPSDIRALWAFVEDLAGETEDLYAGSVYAPGSPVADHYLSPLGRGSLYAYRQRRAEQACAGVTTPHPVFKCIGAANVGTGSVAGMRLLHRIADRAAVWPFAAPGPVTLVEVFPRRYFIAAGQDPRAWRERATVDATLAGYGSAAYSGPVLDTEDKADAVVAAAALRALSEDPAVWSAPGREPASRLEGWIFGVT